MGSTAKLLANSVLPPHHLLLLTGLTHTQGKRRVTTCTIAHKTLLLRKHTSTHTSHSLPFPFHSPPLRLTLALGTTEKLPGCSCKVIKEALTAHWFRPPQSGVYWVTLEEGCGSGHQDRAVKMGSADTGTTS